MKSYCLKCRENTENIKPRVSKTSNGRTMVLSKCAICNSKKSRFIRNKEAKGLLSNLGVNPIQDEGGQKGPPTSFSPVTSTNIGIRPQNVLTFSFNPFVTLV